MHIVSLLMLLPDAGVSGRVARDDGASCCLLARALANGRLAASVALDSFLHAAWYLVTIVRLCGTC